MLDDACELSITTAGRRIRRGKLSILELTRRTLQQIEKLDPEIHAWSRIAPGDAIQRAEELDSLLRGGTDLGPLHGIPLGVKDIFYTAGMETSAGSPILKGFVPDEDATVVRRLRQAGAIILGKTATTEFAAYEPAATRNPYNLEHTPGGSSSGSAAAVATGMCFGALGTQTAGSIIRPAAYCGVVGLKPTFHLISRRGVIPLAWSLDHVGPIARTVKEVCLIFDAIREPDLKLEKLPPAAASSVGIPDRYFLESSEAEVVTAYDGVIRALEQLSFKVRQVRLPPSFEAGAAAGTLILRAEAAAYHRDCFQRRPADYSPRLAALIEAGLRIQGASYLRAQQVRRAAARDMAALLGEIDFLVTPATPTAAPKGLFSTGDPVFNTPFSAFGLPALTIPVGMTADRLPVGCQMVTRYRGDAILLRAGAALEAEIGQGAPPPLG